MTTTSPQDIGYIIPHTHWDREWRYPIWENRLLLVEFMEELFSIIESDPEYRYFLMDGQCVIIEDYLEVRPQDAERVRRHIQDGRIAIGPWYTLPDLYPIDGECLVRNLLKGVRLAEQFGGCMKIGYESFGWGQIAQFPQIFRGFGMDFVVVAKHVSKERAPESEFIWEGPDGSRVLATRLGFMARANFFMNAYIEIMHGVRYRHEVTDYPNEFVFPWGKPGRVYHPANAEDAVNDHFRLEYPDEVHDDLLDRAAQKAWDSTEGTTVRSHRVLMDGCDFSSAQPKLTEIIRKLNARYTDRQFAHGTLDEYMAHLKAHIDEDQLRVITGELRDGSAADCTGNALMTRPAIKRLNKQAQNALLFTAEPLSAMATLCGVPYQREFLDIAMRYLLQSHPHDSINGVTQDKTVDDVLYRLSQVVELGNVVGNYVCKELAKRIDTSAFDAKAIFLTAVNPTATPRRDVVKLSVDIPQEFAAWEFDVIDAQGHTMDTQFIARKEETALVHDLNARPWPLHADRYSIYLDTGEVPAGGYQTYQVVPTKPFKREKVYWAETRMSDGLEIATSANTLENEFLEVTVQENGTITLHDKVLNRTFPTLNYFEDTGDNASYWVHYPPHHNRTFTSLGSRAKIWIEDNGPLAATIAAEITMEVPAYTHVQEHNIRGESKRSDDMRTMTLLNRYTLRRGAPMVEVNVTLDNTVMDHRVRALFDTGIQATHSSAAGHFTVDTRPVTPVREKNGRFYPEMQTLPQQYFVDISDTDGGLAFINNCLVEFEAMPNKKRTVALTLLRGARNELVTDNFALAKFPDQHGGQSLGVHQYAYALMPHAGDWEAAGVYHEAIKFNVPLKVMQISGGQGTLPLTHSFFALEPANLIMSAFKQAEDRTSLILRVYNPTDHAITGTLILATEIQEAYLTTMNEERETALAPTDPHTLTLEVPAQKIVTVELVI